MKRFVTYVYQYERGRRGKNVGFIKTDIRDSGCRMEIHIRGLERFQGRAQVYFIVTDNGAVGVPVGEIPIGQGSGTLKLGFPRCFLGNSSYTVRQVQAIIIRYGGGRMLFSNWSDATSEDILQGNFRIIGETPEETAVKEETPEETAAKEETAAVEEEAPGTEESATEEETIVVEPTATGMETVAEEAAADVADVTAASADGSEKEASPPPEITMKKIEITDIRKLPKRNWHLCNNSFLVHGFFNYHYLMLKTVAHDGRRKCYLGVPGIYEQPERTMALLFGFPEFEPADTENPDRIFGYWMYTLED